MRARLKWTVRAVCLGLSGLTLLAFPAPVAVVSPGGVEDVSRAFEIVGVPAGQVNGRYLATSVRLEQPPLIVLLVGLVRGESEIVPIGDVFGPDPEAELDAARADMDESRRLAAAAAAKAAGLDPKISGTGARVVAVAPGGPSDGRLYAGDVILAVDARPVGLVAEVASAVQAVKPGTVATLTVERQGGTVHKRITTGRAPGDRTRLARLGVDIVTRDLDVVLPFDIRFRDTGDTVGPSAGLAYALAIYDRLSDVDVAGGRAIAATGTIDTDGSVDLIGGVAQKAAAARRAGARMLLVPHGLAADAGAQSRAVRSLAEAIATLRGGV